MKEKKTEPRIFTIADWEKEERYLRKRHQEGWKFLKVSLPGFIILKNAPLRIWFISWIIMKKV